LSWLAVGMGNEEIIEDFSEITIDDIKTCLPYATDREQKSA